MTAGSRVIVSFEESGCRSFRAPQVRHRDYPELRSEGSSACEGAAHLLLLMTRALEVSDCERWQRDHLRRAMADVRAYIESL